jgi:chloride channel 7
LRAGCTRYYYYIWELPVFVLMGVAAGLLGALFIRLNVRVTALRARWVPPRRPHLRLLEVRAGDGLFCSMHNPEP